MSRAFVKDLDGAQGEELPELLVSPHRNLVTPNGLTQIEATVERLQTALSDARAADDRAAIARIQRDLRYWTERRRTAEVVAAPESSDTVRFGSNVTLEKEDGERIEYQIVGEDEADPAKGKVSYVAPIATLLIGTSVGDVVKVADGEAEVIAIG